MLLFFQLKDDLAMNSERLREERWKSVRQPIGFGNEGMVETSMCMFVFKSNLNGITLVVISNK